MNEKQEFWSRVKTIKIDDFQKVLNREITFGEMAKKYEMDVKTLKQKIENLAASDECWKKLFCKYYNRRNGYNGYDFKPEMLGMLRDNLSQTEMAKKIGIPRETLTTKINQLEDSDELKKILQEHSIRKKKHQKMTDEETLKLMIFLDEYQEKNGIDEDIEYSITKGTKEEQRLFYLNQILSLYEKIKYENKDLNEKQIAELLNLDVSTIRRYKSERDSLCAIRDNQTANIEKE